MKEFLLRPRNALRIIEYAAILCVAIAAVMAGWSPDGVVLGIIAAALTIHDLREAS